MEFVIVTGMSGSGKSQAINALEDIGYYCVDNIPPKLIVQFAQLCTQFSVKIEKMAIVVDSRSRSMFGDLSDGIVEMKNFSDNCKIVFLDADNNVLIKRYKETRRKHPLLSPEYNTTDKALNLERKLLENIKSQADYIIDTTYLSISQLKDKIGKIFIDNVSQGMLVNCMSFGFKYGLPPEADLVFDLRCFPNPFYIEELKEKTGLDKEVREYVMKWPQVMEFQAKLLDMLDFLIPQYIEEGKRQLVIAIGCTGGKHRSVVFAELIGEHLKNRNVNVFINHRDMLKTKFSTQ
ncbi:MAG TPA: RNase adapter RapZ [Ruminococcaceae bacterium]|nr:RNase adapter RapZ [Oscillospiraceae bacterium]